mmetsp:Transcript_41393/g.128672  ORF Transcript_41393/g.128672 Transcript_41393/m.128672 type:complete len:648 (+) Transcript_41393:571-2514(+)
MRVHHLQDLGHVLLENFDGHRVELRLDLVERVNGRERRHDHGLVDRRLRLPVDVARVVKVVGNPRAHLALCLIAVHLGHHLHNLGEVLLLLHEQLAVGQHLDDRLREVLEVLGRTRLQVVQLRPLLPVAAPVDHARHLARLDHLCRHLVDDLHGQRSPLGIREFLVVLEVGELEGGLLLGLGHHGDEGDVRDRREEGDDGRAGQHLLPAHVAHGVVHRGEDKRRDGLREVAEDAVEAVPVAELGLRRDLGDDEATGERGEEAKELPDVPDRDEGPLLELDHQQELRREREGAADDGDGWQVAALAKQREDGEGEHDDQEQGQQQVVLPRHRRPLREDRGEDGPARHARALVAARVERRRDQHDLEELGGPRRRDVQGGVGLVLVVVLLLLRRHEHHCHRQQRGSSETDRQPDRIEVVLSVLRALGEGHHDEGADGAADQHHAHDQALIGVALGPGEELPNVRDGDVHADPEEVVPHVAQQEEVIRLGPDRRGVDDDVADDAVEQADLHGQLAADLVAHPAKHVGSRRRAEHADGQHQIHRHGELERRRPGPRALLSLEGVRGDVLPLLLLENRRRQPHLLEEVARPALRVRAHGREPGYDDGRAEDVDKHGEDGDTHDDMLEALVGAELHLPLGKAPAHTPGDVHNL